MVHKIHRGAELVNQPYLVVGFRQGVHDYSDVHFPRDIRGCESCHVEGDGGGEQADHWRRAPSRLACVGCHDDVDFETGANHSDSEIQQFDDAFCGNCHRDEAVVEYDQSIPGAHIPPYDSSANPELSLAITDVTTMTAGAQPAVTFTVSDASGPVDITTLNRVAIVFAGPTADYSQLLSDGRFTIQGGGSTGTLVDNGGGSYTYAPDGYTIPADAAETWSVGMEARTNSIAAGDDMVSFGANNPVVHVDLSDGTLGGGDPEPRRDVVTKEQCDRCHGDLRIHGNLRTEIEYCVLCHNPWATDEARRPGVDPMTNPPVSVDFKLMVHRIHRGSDLAGEYTVFGFGSNPHDYTDVHYPGNVAKCAKCHVEDTEVLPSPNGAVATVVHVAGTPVPQDDAILTPATAACTGCHDSSDALTHARLNSIVNDPDDWAESCSVCHGAGRTEDAAAKHAGD